MLDKAKLNRMEWKEKKAFCTCDIWSKLDRVKREYSTRMTICGAYQY